MTKLKSFIYFQIIVWSLIVIVIATSGCAMVTQPKNKLEFYQENIQNLQERQQQEWSEKLVDKFIRNCLKLVQYKHEGKDENGKDLDHWQTCEEMHQATFRGDCEDIAWFILTELKKAKYPYETRIRAVATAIPDADHALIRVKLPDGTWKTYETVPMMGFEWLDRLFYRTLFEFDLENIYTREEMS